MKYSDLFETRKEEFSDQLTREVMDVLVLYQAAGVNKTNINNIINEMEKLNFSVDYDTMVEIVQKLGFSVHDQIIMFTDEDQELDLEDGEEYDEVENMAKSATDKRLK